MISNVYKHKTSGVCFLVGHLAVKVEGEKFVELFECVLSSKTSMSKGIHFLLDKQWFVSAVESDFEKMPKASERDTKSNEDVSIKKWALFSNITYAGMFFYKTKKEVSPEEVYQYFNPEASVTQ